jgi:hypothetical protein
MVAFNKKTEGGKQVSTHLSPRGNRTNSGQIHSAWVGVSAPQNAPTSLSATPVDTSVSISFTAPTDNGGMDITNYQYAISTNGGSSYSAYAALSPADGVSPITVTGLTQNTAYLIKLKAVNDVGVSDVESSPVSLTTEGVPTGKPVITSVPTGETTATVNYTYPGGGGAVTGWDLYVTNFTNSWNNTTASPISVTGLTPNTTYTFFVRAKNAYGVGPQSDGVNATTLQAAASSVEYLVIAGGGGGGSGYFSGGGGAGGYRSSVAGSTSGRGAAAEAALSVSGGTTYTVTIGGGGGATGNGGNSAFHTVTSSGGGGGSQSQGSAGGCGAGSGWSGGNGTVRSGAAGTAGQGYDGGGSAGVFGAWGTGGGGGGASANGASGTVPNGGAGLSNSITGTAVTRAGGGGGSALYVAGGTVPTAGTGGAGGGGSAGSAGSGGFGGGGGAPNPSSGTGLSGGSGVVIIRYPDSRRVATATTGSPTYTVTGGFRIYQWTGSGSITF